MYNAVRSVKSISGSQNIHTLKRSELESQNPAGWGCNSVTVISIWYSGGIMSPTAIGNDSYSFRSLAEKYHSLDFLQIRFPVEWVEISETTDWQERYVADKTYGSEKYVTQSKFRK